MSKEELVGLIQEQLDDESDLSSRRERELKTAQKGNRVFAENVGSPVYEYLDTIYFDRIKRYIEETYETRIKTLEDRVRALEARVK
jgi:phage baseplate assembly protein W